MASKSYSGPVCYVGEAAAHTIDGSDAEAGWHYTAVVDEEAKQLAVDAAKAQVALWEKRASKRVVGRFVRDQLDAARRGLEAVEDASWEVPGEKLYLDSDTGKYRLASDSDESWHDRHHERFNLIAPGGNLGDPQDADSVRAAADHLDRLEQRLGESGLDEHEDDHIFQTPDEIAHARRFLAKHPARDVVRLTRLPRKS